MSATTKARDGLALISEAVLEHLAKHPEGIGNSELARDLGLESDFQGRQKNYLTWSVIGLLVNEGHVQFVKKGRNVLYKLP
jgi:hypothetical protein